MEEIKIKTGFSQKKNEKEAVSEVFEKINQENIKLIIIFCDGNYDQLKINEAWREKISPETALIGCPGLKISTPFFKVGKMITNQGYRYCMTAMSIASDKIDVAVRLMRDVKNNWEKASTQALMEGAKTLGLDLRDINNEKCFGLFFCDTSSGREENILENFYAMSNLLFVGGGSYGRMDLVNWVIRGEGGPMRGYVHTREGVFMDAAAIALVKSDIPFRINFVTNFFPTQTKFEVTKANEIHIGNMKMWRVDELNGRPALDEYTKALGVSKFALGFENLPNLPFFLNHPLGFMIRDKAYIRFIGVRRGKSLVMSSKVEEGKTLYLMERMDLSEVMRQTMDNLRKELGFISGIILFQCGLQKLDADKNKETEKFLKTINVAPLIGLCTFREYYGWLALEQSLVILSIGDINKK